MLDFNTINKRMYMFIPRFTAATLLSVHPWLQCKQELLLIANSKLSMVPICQSIVGNVIPKLRA